MSSEIHDLLQIGLKAVDLAKGEILKFYGTKITVDWKPDQTPVTIADRNAEDIVRTFLDKETPQFGFLGEESGRARQEAEYHWVLDPIDGTKSFVRGVPLFGTILALYRKDEPIVGLIGLPALHSVLHASSGGGAWVDGSRAQVSTVDRLDNATVLSGTVNTMEARGFGDGFANLRRSSQLYRGWGDCYGYYLVACGRAEVMVDPVVSIWDVAAMPIIFQEAGGRFSEINGNTRFFDEQGQVTAGPEGFTGFASNMALYQQGMQKLQAS